MPGSTHPQPGRVRLVGVLSDTHGLVRPGVIRVFETTELIIHAGDIGKPEVLEALRRVAPVIAVRGNVDRGEWAQGLHETEVVEIDDVVLYVLHDLSELDLDPAAAGFSAVISGHSHRSALREDKGVLYLNPGNAGPRRFKLPVSVALLQIRGNALDAQVVELEA